jgi:coenzyme Q-binding protein COQ10
MLRHIEQKTLPYTPEQMFNLVADVGRYKEFVPWCTGSRVTRALGEGAFEADLDIGYGFLTQRFSSRVGTMAPEGDAPGRIDITYLKGPMKDLKNYWKFTRTAEGLCLIDFNVEFEFTNKGLQAMAEMFFQKVVTRMVSAFEARAREVYGSGLSASPS